MMRNTCVCVSCSRFACSIHESASASYDAFQQTDEILVLQTAELLQLVLALV